MPGNPWNVEGIGADRVRVTLDDASRIIECVESLGGLAAHFAVESPVHTVEWRWPLTLAVAPGLGSAELLQELSRTRGEGHPWKCSTTDIVETPVSDVLFFADGLHARTSLDDAPAPMSADLLVLCGVPRESWSEIALQSVELLALSQAHAILAVSEPAPGVDWFWSFMMELSHNVSIDEAAARVYGPQIALWSTRQFIEQAVLKNFLQPLTRRIRLSPSPLKLNLSRLPLWRGRIPEILGVTQALEILGLDFLFSSESEGASLISEMARASSAPAGPGDYSSAAWDDGSAAEAMEVEAALEPAEEAMGGEGAESFQSPAVAPPPPAPEPVGAPASMADLSFAAPDKPAKQPERYLLHKLAALQQTRLKPEEALEAGKSYGLTVKLGPKEKGWRSGKESLPEPPVAPEDAGVMLAVVFTERNSSPAGQLKTVFLPKTGASSECVFEFTASPASRLFEGWISIYHNNRLLQEGVLRAEVVGGAETSEAVPSKTEFRIGAMPRPLSLGVRDAFPVAGTVRLEAGEGLTAVRGIKAASLPLSGLKTAVEALSAEFDQIKWETMRDWQKDKTAARSLSRIAQLGWQMWREVMSNPVAARIAGSEDPLVVYASDSGIRAPLELCYDLPQPKSDATVCSAAAGALRNGVKCGDCGTRQNSRDVVCPLGFWGMRRVIEWHSETADSRPGDTVEITNEPVKDRDRLAPLRKVLRAQSALVTGKESKKLDAALKKNAHQPVLVAPDWDSWAEKVRQESPSMLLLIPHVDHSRIPPAMEIQDQFKDPPGVDAGDVVGAVAQCPLVLLLGCGAAHASVDFMSLPAQFRRSKAAIVIAPIAELFTGDAPEIARAFVETVAASAGEARPAGKVLLDTKRRLLSEGRLAGLMLLAAGDASWLIES